jgi:hypothetical protein
MHISSQNGSDAATYLEQIRTQRASLRTLSLELFLELDDLWVDRLRLTETSPTAKLLKAISTCQQLTNLQFYSPRATSIDTIPLLVTCLTPDLSTLSITRSVRFETAEHVEQFAVGLRSCRNLSDFKLVHPHCEVPIDPIVSALAELPVLQSVDITLFTDVQCDTTFVSQSSLRKLLRSPRLTALSLWGCSIQDCHLKVLQETNRLSFLSLRRNPQIDDWKQFYHSLQTNFALKALYNDHADLMSCMHPSMLYHSPDTPETAAICAAEICLALNRLGRGEDDEEDFLDLLESVNESSMALYYLLRSRPSVWCERSARKLWRRRARHPC